MTYMITVIINKITATIIIINVNSYSCYHCCCDYSYYESFLVAIVAAAGVVAVVEVVVGHINRPEFPNLNILCTNRIQVQLHSSSS